MIDFNLMTTGRVRRCDHQAWMQVAVTAEDMAAVTADEGGQHAGSAPSPLLQAALLQNQEGIRGVWLPPAEKLPYPTPPADLEYLTGLRRVTILGSLLRQDFNVAPKSGGSGTVRHKGGKIVEVSPPLAADLATQVRYVRGYADLRVDRGPEIYTQMTDIFSFFGQATRLNGRDREATLELLSIVQGICISLEMPMKHYCWLPRPVDMDPLTLPVIQTPDHSSFPSGHAVEAFATARILSSLMTLERPTPQSPSAWTTPYRIAHRIAANRVIAGVHYPIDSIAGAVMGVGIADAILTELGLPLDGTFIANTVVNGNDFLNDDATPDVLMPLLGLADSASEIGKDTKKSDQDAKPAKIQTGEKGDDGSLDRTKLLRHFGQDVHAEWSSFEVPS